MKSNVHENMVFLAAENEAANETRQTIVYMSRVYFSNGVFFLLSFYWNLTAGIIAFIMRK